MRFWVLFLLAGCSIPVGPAQQVSNKPLDQRGDWVEIEPPPGHPEQECFTYRETLGRFSGAVCFPKD